MSSTLATLDDRSPKITYQGEWRREGIVGKEFDGTTTGTNSSGNSATITLVATQFEVFGTVIPVISSAVESISSYSIDNGTSVFFTGNPSSEKQFQQLFFKSQQLSAGEHTLTITNVVSGGRFYLDIINITIPDTATTGELNTTSSTSLSAPASLSTPTSTSLFITTPITKATEAESTSKSVSAHSPASLSITTSTPSSTTSPMSSTGIFPAAGRSAGKKLPVAMIVLGVFLGILFFVLVTIGIIFLKKKQQGRRKGIDRFPLDLSPALGDSALDPFMKGYLVNGRGVTAEPDPTRPLAYAF